MPKASADKNYLGSGIWQQDGHQYFIQSSSFPFGVNLLRLNIYEETSFGLDFKYDEVDVQVFRMRIISFEAMPRFLLQFFKNPKFQFAAFVFKSDKKKHFFDDQFFSNFTNVRILQMSEFYKCPNFTNIRISNYSNDRSDRMGHEIIHLILEAF